MSPLFVVVMVKPEKEGDKMSKREEYEARTEALLLPIMEEMHFELVDVEYVKEGSTWYLRAYIDKEDFISDSYVFEVSSPGLGRPLKKEKDYVRSMGKELEIRTYRAINRQKEFYGVLTAYTDDTVTICTEEDEELTFQKNEIALIRLAFDF